MSAVKRKQVKQSSLKQLLTALDKDLSQEERILVFAQLNKSLKTFPLEDVIKFRKDGALLINGRTLTLEQFQNFRGSIDALKSNYAFQVIADQLLFKAIAMGLHQCLTPDQIIFSKSTVWFIQEYKKLLESLDTLN